MPVFAWTMLILAGMIIFAFPAVILATVIARTGARLRLAVFRCGEGGDPLLWQHLFWFFGHPEVYIIFLPAARHGVHDHPDDGRNALGRLPADRRRFDRHGVFSFGLWVHPHVHHRHPGNVARLLLGGQHGGGAVPSGIQVFAWIATIAAGKLRWSTPSLFVLGFIFIFTLGGLTGVMVAMVPFDWQAHDTLLRRGAFPLRARSAGWCFRCLPPSITGRRRSAAARCRSGSGKWAFWLMFSGFNVAFFPMHITGLMGMPGASAPTPTSWNGAS